MKLPQITRSNIQYCYHWQKIRTIVLSYLSGAFPTIPTLQQQQQQQQQQQKMLQVSFLGISRTPTKFWAALLLQIYSCKKA